jgi:hypothetical protein
MKQHLEETLVQFILLNAQMDALLKPVMFGELPFIFKNHQFVKLLFTPVLFKMLVVSSKW